ncbi:MAG TPA: sigma-70 family RNA polymerase sigma factor [Kofleriaceae bacterium]|nr:sigma-70 family RNA polymerase sigma factor [Kofleriaceae bacterium]
MDAPARARLVESHLDVARRAALVVYPRVREHVELDELIALANAGLAEAATRFDPDRGASFATFAWYRVQGAIIDGLRRSANLPRRVWQKVVALRAASDYLEQRGERDAGAAKTGAPPASGADALASIQGALSAIRTMYVLSLDATETALEVPDDAPASDEVVHSGRLARMLRVALRRLPERERAIVEKHYFEGKNLLEAGAELGISKSWASRLHAQAVERLRAVVDAEAA